MSARSDAVRLCFDITGALRQHRWNPVGIVRVERSYGLHCLDHAKVPVQFCRFDAGIGHLVAVSDDKARAVLAPPPGQPVPKRSPPGRLRHAGRRIERAFRRSRRRLIRRIIAAIPILAARRNLVEFTGSDVYVMVGETWNTQDLEYLLRTKKKYRFRAVMLCHDLIPVTHPHFFRNDFAYEKFNEYLDMMALIADVIICISKNTKRDLEKYYESKGVPGPELRVVTLGSDLSMTAPAKRPDRLAAFSPGDFVLTVSTIQGRKNFDLLYHIWRRLAERPHDDAPKLVIVGIRGWLAGDLLHKIDKDPVVAGRIAIVEDASDRDLAWLYGNCRFTVYPSFYEGWGLPVAESLAYGKYCVASSTSSLPEVGQGLIKHIDPLDFVAWYDEVESLISDPAKLARLEARIESDYRAVTWKESGDRFLREVLSVAARSHAAQHADRACAPAPRLGPRIARRR